MIDKGVFANEWTLLCERFRKTGKDEPSQIMRKRYYEYLSPRMDTAEFKQMAMLIYTEHEFFPKPGDFLPSRRDMGAALEWEKVQKLLRNAASPLDSLDEPAQRAVRALGGLAIIGQEESKVHFFQTKFFDLYEQYSEDRDTIPQLTDEGRALMRKALAENG